MKWFTLGWVALLLGTAAGCHESETQDNQRRADKKHGATASKAEPSAAKTSGTVVALAEAAIVSSQLRTVEVRTGSGVVTARFPGNIAFDQNATAVVQPPLEGRLKQWRVNIGAHVKKEDVLAFVENPQNLDAPTPLKAPLDGEIIERNAALGDWVKPGDRLAVITELHTMWAVARVREDMVGKILTDTPATIHALSFPGDTFTGTLLRVASSVEPESRTVEFVYTVANPGRKLRAGMFTQVSLATDRVQNTLLVPDEAVQTIGSQPVVFVEQERGRYRIAPVLLGRKLGETSEVLGGLSNGMRVVTTGSFVLKSEALRDEFVGDKD